MGTMMRRKGGVLSLIVWMVAGFLITPSASACVWCDSAQWLNFQDCLYWETRNEPTFSQLPVEALDDMRNSITAASQAITEGRSSMKMKMLVGAMAGEMSELIKPMSSNAADGRAKDILMNIVRVCNVEVSGQPDVRFIDELSRILDFMMNEPSYYSAASASNDNNALPQNAVQSSINPANFNGQNFNNQPPNFNNMRQQESQSQLPSSKTMLNNAAPSRGNNQQDPSGSLFPNNQNAGSSFPGQVTSNQRNVNAGSLSYPSQPQITNANEASGFNSFNQNPSINPSATSSSYSLAQSSGFEKQVNPANTDSGPYELEQYPTVQAENANVNPRNGPYPPNPSSFIQPGMTRANAASSANSYNLASTNTFTTTDQNNKQNQFPPRDSFPVNNQVSSYSTNNLPTQQFPPESPINQPQSAFRGSDTKTFEINAQNVPQNNQQNQFIQYPVSNGNGLGQSGTYPSNNIQRQSGQNNVIASPPNYDYRFPDQYYPNNPAANTPLNPSSGSSVVTNSNSQGFITQESGNFPSNYPEITNKTPKKVKKNKNRTPSLKPKKKL